jgi:hypothetical protein
MAPGEDRRWLYHRNGVGSGTPDAFARVLWRLLLDGEFHLAAGHISTVPAGGFSPGATEMVLGVAAVSMK